MQGPMQPGDQPPDPRDSTVSMPRINPSLLAGQTSDSASAASGGGTRMELPGFGDPYALPVRAPQEQATGRLSEPEARALPAAPEVAAPPEDIEASEVPGHPGAANQGGTERPPRRAVRRSERVEAGKPPVGSLAELRGRLEGLPDGHPSSPYDDGGWLRPSPTRLRQLELGLPVRSLGTAPADVSSRRKPSEPPAPAETPEGLVTMPTESPFPAADMASNGHNEPGNGDGRLLSSGGTTPGNHALQLQHPYAPSGEHDGAGRSSRTDDVAVSRAPASGAAAHGRSGPAEDRNGHRPAAKLPAASRAEPAVSEPERHRADPGRGDLPRRGDAAASDRPLLALEQRDLVDRIMAACRAAEGRNDRGGYGSSGLTPVLRRIAAQLPAGGLAPGSQTDTLKPADRFAARLARLIDRQPGRPPAELAATICDGIRYAFSFPAAEYTEGTLLVHRKLKAQGFDLEARRNQWDSHEYKGVFTRWRDPAHHLAFEVQFHTADSWAVIRQTHDAYLRITDPVTPPAERARLRARQAAAAATVSPPPGCRDIADFRAGAR